MNKRILILANNSGGLYGFRKELIQQLLRKGMIVYASTPFDENVDDLSKMGVKLIETKMDRRGMNPFKDFDLIMQYNKIIKKVKPSIVITYTIKPNLYGGVVAKWAKVPFAINVTGLGTAFQKDNIIRKMVVSWYKYVCKKVKVVFFENIGNRDIFLDFNIVNKEKCCVLNGAGVNLNHYNFSDYPKDDNKIHFLFIGRIMREKGINELFWAMEKICQEYKNVVLDVVGPFEDDYADIIEKLKVKGVVNYYGYQSDVRPFIQNCHCFVLPSYHEGMANTLLESAAIGRPLITSNIHGCLEAVEDGKSGFLVESKNQEELFAKMKQFIEMPHIDKVNMGILSRKHVEENFDKKVVVNKTIEELMR